MDDLLDEATNDQYDLEYEYLDNRTSGVLVFTAPDKPGSYDFRMHDRNDGGVEVAYVSFTVVSAEMKPTLNINKRSYYPREDMIVSFTASSYYQSNAWIGIIPSHVPHGSEATNDLYDISYQYLDGKTSGTLIFQAPDTPGSYDLRMHDTDSGGNEVTYITFIVQ